MVDLIQIPFLFSFVLYVQPTHFALDIDHWLVNVMYVLPHIDNHPFAHQTLPFFCQPGMINICIINVIMGSHYSLLPLHTPLMKITC